jgi:hypothetical protein
VCSLMPPCNGFTELRARARRGDIRETSVSQASATPVGRLTLPAVGTDKRLEPEGRPTVGSVVAL